MILNFKGNFLFENEFPHFGGFIKMKFVSDGCVEVTDFDIMKFYKL